MQFKQKSIFLRKKVTISIGFLLFFALLFLGVFGFVHAVDLPDVPNDVAAVADVGYLNVTVTWSAPTPNGSQLPTQYFINAKRPTADWTDSDVVATSTDGITFTTTLQLPGYGDFDIGVVAGNDLGQGPASIISYTTPGSASTTSITSCAQLQAIDADPLTGYADNYNITVATIDCTGIDFQTLSWNLPFSGIFDGQLNTITNFSITQTIKNQGLFTIANRATIENLTVIGIVSGESNLGVLVGNGTNLTIQYITSNVTVSGSSGSVGGLVGNLVTQSGTSTFSHNTILGSVSAGTIVAGGLVGEADLLSAATLQMDNNSVSATISSVGLYAGGLVGFVNYNATRNGVDSSAVFNTNTSTGNVSSSTDGSIGGMIGQVSELNTATGTINFTFTNNSSVGNVTGAGASVGGLIGFAYSESDSSGPANFTVSGNSYATGTVSSTGANVGGLFGAYEAHEYTGTGIVTYTFSQNKTGGTISGVAYTGGQFGYISSQDDTASDRISGTISQSYSFATIGGTGPLSGGFAGDLLSLHVSQPSVVQLTVSDIYANGAVTGDLQVGGLIGEIETAHVFLQRSYASGSVTGINTFSSNDAGGLVGHIEGGIVRDSFSSGAVSNFVSTTGGFIGTKNSLTISDSFYDKIGSLQSTCLTSGDISGCTAVNTLGVPNSTYFYNTSTNAPFSGGTTNWDFAPVGVWIKHPATYPTLYAFDTSTAPVVSITAPASSDTVLTWAPVVNWGTSSTCTYSYTTVFSTVDCSQNGADIPAPAEGSATLHVQGASVSDKLSTVASSTFTYSPDSAPVFSAISVSPAQTTSTITWTTDKNASSKVEYGLTTGYGTLTTETDTSTRVILHSAIVSGLTCGTTYYFRVISTDILGTTGTSSGLSFSTSACSTTTTTRMSGGGGFIFLQPQNIPLQKTSHHIFKFTFGLGMRSFDVFELQKYLNTHGIFVTKDGPGSVGNETTYFGLATKKALTLFQEFHSVDILEPLGLKKGTGIFGPSTMKYMNSH